nr:MAG TPA: hypothetical protein [Caudoviricetes sp.]
MKLSNESEITNAKITLEEIIRSDADYLPTYFAPEEIAALSDFANGFDVDANNIVNIIGEIAYNFKELIEEGFTLFDIRDGKIMNLTDEYDEREEEKEEEPFNYRKWLDEVEPIDHCGWMPTRIYC